MSYYLFLDDSRQPSKVTWMDLPQNVEWVVAKSYQEFVVAILTRGIPKFVTYDCDLCDEHYKAFFEMRHRYVIHYNEFKTKCGIDCAEWMLKQCQRLKIPHPEFLAHTMNTYARGFIENKIKKYNAKFKKSHPSLDSLVPKEVGD